MSYVSNSSLDGERIVVQPLGLPPQAVRLKPSHSAEPSAKARNGGERS
jgi:hypothetical protein